MKFSIASSSVILASSLLLADSSLAFPLSSPENNNPPQAPVSYNLYRRAPAFRSGEKLLDWADSNRVRVQAKYGLGKGKNASKRATGQALTNLNFDSTWVAQVQVGTPSHNYAVVLDTGSSDFWLSGGTVAQQNANTNVDSSSPPFRLQYGSGQVVGYVVQDTATLANVTVNNFKLAIATQASRSLLQANIDGIMGFGFQKLSVQNNPTFWEAANIDTFSFYLERRKLDGSVGIFDSKTAYGGIFTLGGTNSTLYKGDISYFNLIEPLYWMIPIGGLSASGKSVSVGITNRAAIDTGTTLIGGPDDVVQQFYAGIDGAQPIPNRKGYYAYPCSSSINATLTFGNQQYSISDDDFNSGTVDSNGNFCMGAIFGVGSSAQDDLQWIVGDTFLKNVYTVFTNANNKPRVGFASLANGLNGGTTSTTVTNDSVVSPSSASSHLTVTSASMIFTIAGVMLTLITLTIF